MTALSRHYQDLNVTVVLSIVIYFFQSVTPHGFRMGMKLEAIDKKNTALTCVATVVDVLGDRILIHFDGWEDSYDYWCDPFSPYIHPVGWCQEQGKPLSPPNGKLAYTRLDDTFSLFLSLANGYCVRLSVHHSRSWITIYPSSTLYMSNHSYRCIDLRRYILKKITIPSFLVKYSFFVKNLKKTSS